jgi:hypothetical protein
MKRAFLLGPGRYADRPSGSALAERRRLAGFLLAGRDVLIMEDAPAEPGETDADKFLRLVRTTDEIVVWMPQEGRIPTV